MIGVTIANGAGCGLSELQPQDLILFTDVSGDVHCYEVVLLETLPGNATEEMITSGFDLSLYTCTTGGGSRVTVRCASVKNENFISKTKTTVSFSDGGFCIG